MSGLVPPTSKFIATSRSATVPEMSSRSATVPEMSSVMSRSSVLSSSRNQPRDNEADLAPPDWVGYLPYRRKICLSPQYSSCSAPPLLFRHAVASRSAPLLPCEEEKAKGHAAHVLHQRLHSPTRRKTSFATLSFSSSSASTPL